MKRITVAFILFCSLFSLLAFTSAYAYSPSVGVPIVIGTGGDGSGGGEGGGEGDDPNSLAPVPITCEYIEDIPNLMFSFYSDLGNVSITITNLLTGEIVSRVVDTQLGIVNIPISGSAGYYYISIITPSGLYYHGQFTI